MSLEYLKIAPEEAVKVLEEQIVKGYQLKDDLHKDYSQDSNISGERITAWRERLNSWTQDVIQKLQDIYLGVRQAYNFRDAKKDGLTRININVDFENIIKTLQSRIDILNSYTDFIFNHANISITAGRDANVQIGNQPKMEVKNDTSK